MANIKDLLQTFDADAEFEDLSEELAMLKPDDTPVQDRVLGSTMATDTVHKWEEDALTSITDTTGAAVSTSQATVAVTDGTRFIIGDLCVIDDKLAGSSLEIMRITGISTNTLTVTRGFGDSSTTSHAASQTIRKIGNALIEGADALTDSYTTVTKKSNHTQIIADTMKLSGTKMATKSPGGREWPRQLTKKMLEHKLYWENAFIWGTRTTGTGSVPGSTGGLVEWISTHKTNQAGTLSKLQMDAFLASIWDSGGKPDVIVCGTLFARVLNQLSFAKVETRSSDTSVGTRVAAYTSIFNGGDLPILLSRKLPSGSALVLQSDLLKKAVLRSTRLVPLARTGDFDKAMILTEQSLERRLEDAHGFVYGVTGAA